MMSKLLKWRFVILMSGICFLVSGFCINRMKSTKMKTVILSADGDSFAYSVPSTVANKLDKYCCEFCDWLSESPDAEKYYRVVDGVVVCFYDEKDFIEYLNTRVFPEMPSVLIENIGNIYEKKDMPKKYRRCKCFNF